MFNHSSELIGWFVEKKHNITKHFYLSEANEKLAAENAYLHSMMPESFYQLQHRIYYVNDTLCKQQYSYIAAEVINSTAGKRNNYFTINVGAESGIKEQMGVMSKDGIIGYVIDVSDHLATVKTLLSDDMNTNVKLKKNNEHWFLKWDGFDNKVVQVNGVNRDIDIAVGDTIVTRAGKGTFPANLPVGIVDELISQDGKQTWDVNIRLSVNFESVHHVYVIKNFFQEEQTELEKRTLANE